MPSYHLPMQRIEYLTYFSDPVPSFSANHGTNFQSADLTVIRIRNKNTVVDGHVCTAHRYRNTIRAPIELSVAVPFHRVHGHIVHDMHDPPASTDVQMHQPVDPGASAFITRLSHHDSAELRRIILDMTPAYWQTA